MTASHQARRQLLSALHLPLLTAGLFSVFINLMLMAPILFMLQVFDRVLHSRSETTLYMLSAIVLMALLTMAVVDVARSRLLQVAAARVDGLLARPLLQRLVMSSRHPAGGPAAGDMRDVAVLRGFLSGSQIVALFDAPWLLLFISVIFLFHPALGVLALGGAILMVVLAWLSEVASRRDHESAQAGVRQGVAWIDQGLQRAEVLNSMGMVPSFVRYWGDINEQVLGHLMRSGRRMGQVQAATRMLRQGIQVCMMGLGVWLVIHESITPGVMIASTILLGRAMAPVESLIGNWQALVAIRSAWQRLLPHGPSEGQDVATLRMPPLQGHVQMERVGLAGVRADRPILKNIRLDLPAGQSLALLGPSGSGKSSLGRLMAGVWLADTGVVRLDGADIRHWDPVDRGALTGYLPQDVGLFPGTVAENIGRWSERDDEAVLEAARDARALEIILRLPDGFQTRIGEGGIRLSAGQVQRIGLARALYGRPSLVVLDEPNANLDAEGEQALLQVLAHLRGRGCSVVLITHKPSLVAGLDHIAVMRDGVLETVGPREELMRRLTGQPVIPTAGERTP
ncbi:MAG: type I secretion system permease/ATPase [Burkholderiaceae bacterium]